MEDDFRPDELKHYGRKGMKWYQHIFGDKTKGLLKSRTKTETEEERAERLQKEKEERKRKVSTSRSAKQVYDNADLFSDQELQRIYNRLQLERNIKNLSGNEKSKSEEYIDRIIKTARKSSDFIESGGKLYNNIAKVYNSLSDKGQTNPLRLIDFGGGNKKKKNKNQNDNQNN